MVTLDARHNQGAGATEHYAIATSASVILDAETVPLVPPPGVGTINVVHLLHGQARYRMPWDGRGRVTLSPDTLVVEMGPPRFPGFERGETYVIGVGADAADGGGTFRVAWAGMVDVRE